MSQILFDFFISSQYARYYRVCGTLCIDTLNYVIIFKNSVSYLSYFIIYETQTLLTWNSFSVVPSHYCLILDSYKMLFMYTFKKLRVFSKAKRKITSYITLSWKSLNFIFFKHLLCYFYSNKWRFIFAKLCF